MHFCFRLFRAVAIISVSIPQEHAQVNHLSPTCSFDFDLEAEQALLDDLDWDEYNNPINDLSLDFDSTLSSPTEWVQDPTEW